MTTIASTLSSLECPICFEEMKPPTRIFQCIEGHSLCEQCKDRASICPSCRTDMGPGRVSRNRLAEELIREQAEVNNNQRQRLLLVTNTCTSNDRRNNIVLGLYRKAGLYKGVQYYQHLDTRNNRLDGRHFGHFIYQDNNKWYIGIGVGSTMLAPWENQSSSDTVPVTGWQFRNLRNGNMDPNGGGIRVTPVENMANIECGDITITVSGEAARHVSVRECAGVFKQTGEISRGRQMFKNTQTGKYLNVGPGHQNWVWGVRENIDSDCEIGIQSSYALDMCPASQSHDWYSYVNDRRHPNSAGNGISVKCSKHSPQAAPAQPSRQEVNTRRWSRRMGNRN